MAVQEHEPDATPADSSDTPTPDRALVAVPPAANHIWDRALRVVDRVQQGNPPLAVVGGVHKKGGEDQLGLLAAVMSHYGMLSVFPLLLLLVTVAGWIFRDDDAAQRAIVDAALENFPVLGEYLRASIRAIPGSGVAVLVGTVVLLWASLGFTKTAQVAMAEIWSVPRRLRPGFFPHLARSLWALAMLAIPTILTATITIVTTEVGGLSLPALPTWFEALLRYVLLGIGITVFLAINFSSHLLAFRALTPRIVPTRHLIPGTIGFTLFWVGVVAFGSTLLTNRLDRANQLYGTIGFVIGLIFWIYLGAYGALLSAEANVVRARHLYPRTLFGLPRTKADRRALRARASTEELVPGQVVEVRFDDLPPDPPAP
jgi:YihY family inner membrane protein